MTPAKDGAWDYENPAWEMAEFDDRKMLARERLAQQERLLPQPGDGQRARQLKEAEYERMACRARRAIESSAERVGNSFDLGFHSVELPVRT